jgi:uncharacterized cupin superfamily protein
MIPSVTSGELRSAPIEPSWIHEGRPMARNTMLSRSADGMAWTLVWDCTAGRFEWHYDIDETIHFIEGSATISDGISPPKTFRAGDVLFIPAAPSATGMSKATCGRSPSAGRRSRGSSRSPCAPPAGPNGC